MEEGNQLLSNAAADSADARSYERSACAAQQCLDKNCPQFIEKE